MSELKEETTIDIIEAEDPAETEKTVEAENTAETELSEAAEQEEKADPEGNAEPAEKSDKETVSETEDGGPDGTATADEEQESGFRGITEKARDGRRIRHPKKRLRQRHRHLMRMLIWNSWRRQNVRSRRGS